MSLFQLSELCPFENCKKKRNVYPVKTMCRLQLRLLSVSSFKSYDPLIVFLCYFV